MTCPRLTFCRQLVLVGATVILGMPACLSAPSDAGNDPRLAQSYAGIGAESPTVEMLLEQGDEAVYVGSGAASRTWHGSRREVKFDFTLTQLALERDASCAWKTSNFWEVEFSKDTNRDHYHMSRVQTQLASGRLMPFDSDFRQYSPDTWGAFETPGSPGRKMRLGDEWEGTLDAGRNIYWKIPVRGRIAAREEVSGRSCLRVELTPSEPLPIKLKEQTTVDGMPPAPATLVEFTGRVWIAEDDGWVVKLERSVQVNLDGERNPDMSWSLSMTLKSNRRLYAEELALRTEQVGRIFYINSYRQIGWRHLHNLTEGCEIAADKIAEFRRLYPSSPYEPALAAAEKEFSYQRRDIQANGDSGQSDMLGKPVADFTAQRADGSAFRPDDLKDRPALLVFLRRLNYYENHLVRDLREFAEEWKPRGIEIVGVLPTRDELQAVASDEPSSRIVWVGPASGLSLISKAPSYTMARVVAIDPEGIIRYYRAGFYPKELTRTLEELLKQ